MKNLLSYILTNILDDGTNFAIEEETQDSFVRLTVSVPKEKMGRVIGKNGRIINSIKNILKIKAIKEEKKIDIQVTEKI